MKRTLILLALILPFPAMAEDVLRFKEQTIVAKVQKPEVSYVLTKQDLTPRYEFELKESFLPRIEQSIEQKPF